ncbi:MAG: porin, partial [Nitrospirales bacterium]
ISGFVDVSYTHNFNNPSDRANPGRIFDTKDDDFTLHQTQLFFERAAVAGSDPLGRAGFGLRLVYGRDAEVLNSSGIGKEENFDFEEAYLTYAVNDTLQAKLGKYVTLLGAEVIDNTGNFNISRSFLFGHAIPFTHNGLRLTYMPSDRFQMNIGVVNGWDEFVEQNNTKSLEWNVVLNLPGNISWSHAIIYGDEKATVGDNQRVVYDSVFSIQPHDQWTFVINFDYGNEQGASVVKPGTDAEWIGVAGYIHYDASDQFGLTVRGEVFEDTDGFRNPLNLMTGIKQTLYEVTLTGAYKLTPALETRLEYRYDDSSKSGGFGGENNQSTIATEVIFQF